SLMYSHNARYFDLDNFVVTSSSITGPWAKPVFLHSVGFDPSFLHDEDGKSYLVCLQWELREGDGRPDCIVLQEYDRHKQALLGPLVEIYRGATTRGCLEGPHLYKHNGYYYLFAAEGGTGYGHCVTVARSKSVWGPYEGAPNNPLLSAALDFDESDNAEYLKPHRFNPESPLQKTGHASLVQVSEDYWYIAFLCSRPFVPELRSTLGRESSLERVYWTEEGWLMLENNLKIPHLEIESPPIHTYKTLLHRLPDCATTWFKEPLPAHFITPRYPQSRFASLSERPGFLRLTGKQSLCSLDVVAFVARRMQSLSVVISTQVEFTPDDWRQSAGLVMYHDHMNYRFLRITYDEAQEKPVLMITSLTNGVREEHRWVELENAIPIRLGLVVQERTLRFYWTEGSGKPLYEEQRWQQYGEGFTTSELSDEFSEYGEFTGTFVGMACEDFKMHQKSADFAWFDYQHGVLG
ncbi:MAG: glycoside hydrolase family 43 protein, partial [Spirochaetia bacterium]|nr:glycoside hydrolase family 43 protein [Spirochaetia bacterium]